MGNLLHRKHGELTYNVLYDDYGYGNTIWSPVAQGLLSGKYNDGELVDGRLKTCPVGNYVYWNAYFSTPEKKESTCSKLKAMQEYCDTKLNCTMAQLAIAWTCKLKATSVCLFGASK